MIVVDLRKLSALVAAPVLVAGTTVGLAATSAAPAAAACASGLSSTRVASSATGKPQVSVAKKVVEKSKKKYAASTTVKATYGHATASVRDTVCTGDAAARTLTWDYTAPGVGTFTKSVTATGTSKAKAKSALAKKVKAAKKSLSATAKKRGESAAASQASSALKTNVTGLSHVVYLTSVAEGVFNASKTPSAGMMRISQTSTGVTNLVVPASYDDTSLACVTAGSSWPTQGYLVDTGNRHDGYVVPGSPSVTVTNPSGLLAAVQDEDTPAIQSYSLTLTGTEGTSAGIATYLAWDATDGTLDYAGESNPTTLMSGRLVCFRALSMPVGTVSIHGLRVAAGFAATDDSEPSVLTVTKPVKVKIG